MAIVVTAGQRGDSPLIASCVGQGLKTGGDVVMLSAIGPHRKNGAANELYDRAHPLLRT
ncbi:hypothetical protein [Streptomyces sp. WM6372]|uniref:hypothetical protein n=1 Tax=Streptomyces sp. WM6372 TaxID=1415555 RepID=UPI000B1F6DBB|nr:hypothetical protein [Streptomyces sp. WM6372]